MASLIRISLCLLFVGPSYVSAATSPFNYVLEDFTSFELNGGDITKEKNQFSFLFYDRNSAKIRLQNMPTENLSARVRGFIREDLETWAKEAKKRSDLLLKILGRVVQERDKIIKAKGISGPFVGERNPIEDADKLMKSIDALKDLYVMDSVLIKQAQINLEAMEKIEQLKKQNENLVKAVEQLARNLLEESCTRARCVEGSSQAISNNSRDFIQKFIDSTTNKSEEIGGQLLKEGQ